MKAAGRERARDLARELRALERPVRILRSLAWPREVKQRFLERGARELPRVAYPPFEAGPIVERAARLRARLAPEDPVDGYFDRVARAVGTSARMLAAVGTLDFLAASVELYGAPELPLADGRTTPLDLARTAEALFHDAAGLDLGAPPPARFDAEDVAERLRAGLRRFRGRAPQVLVVDDLSANAIAGARTIRLRRGARFTDKDALQLLHHEAWIHSATSLNGEAQVDLPILAAGHAGTTRTQEGLAVLGEFLGGAMEPERFRRLAGRVLAIRMAMQGADFLDVHRFFLGRGNDADQAFENARRVFRGGVLTGGVPFTKDVVYLDGLLRVTNFLRSVVAEGRLDCLGLLFCGKLDLEDVPALSRLAAAGLCRPPRLLPPWAVDRRFLVTYLAFSRFLDRVDLESIRRSYAALFAHTERLPRFLLAVEEAGEAAAGAAPGEIPDGARPTGGRPVGRGEPETLFHEP